MVDVEEDVQVMRVIMADLPPALSMEELKEVAEHDKVYQKLKAAVKEGKKPKDRDLVPYMAVWGELTVIKELVCRGERIIKPEGRCTKNDLRDWIIDLGHTNPAKDRKEMVEAKKDDKLAKDKMKKYNDDSRHVRAHGIKVGDLVIVKRKETKHNSAYDPKPYKVVATYGTQIKGMREDGKHKTRDSKRWKKVQVQNRRSYGEVERPSS